MVGISRFSIVATLALSVSLSGVSLAANNGDEEQLTQQYLQARPYHNNGEAGLGLLVMIGGALVTVALVATTKNGAAPAFTCRTLFRSVTLTKSDLSLLRSYKIETQEGKRMLIDAVPQLSKLYRVTEGADFLLHYLSVAWPGLLLTGIGTLVLIDGAGANSLRSLP